MEKKVVDLAKEAGFYVDSLGGVWAGKESGEVTAETLVLAREIVDRCIRTVALLGSDKDDERSVAIREAVSQLENSWGIAQVHEAEPERHDILFDDKMHVDLSGDKFKDLIDALKPPSK